MTWTTNTRDDTVEAATGVTESMLPCCELTEVFSSSRNIGVIQLEDNAAARFLVHGNVKLQ